MREREREREMLLTRSMTYLCIELLFTWIIGFNLTICGGAATTTQSEEGISVTIAGYLPDYRSYINLNNTIPHITDLILFSLVPHSRGMLGGCCLQEHHFQQAREALAFANEQEEQENSRKESHELTQPKPFRIWVTIGGAGDRSESLAKVAADPKLRKRLIDAIIRLW